MNNYYFEEVLSAINKLIGRGIKIIDIGRIREINHVEKSDRSKTNFIWRNLVYLEKLGHIELINNSTPKRYKLPANKIFLGTIQQEKPETIFMNHRDMKNNSQELTQSLYDSIKFSLLSDFDFLNKLKHTLGDK